MPFEHVALAAVLASYAAGRGGSQCPASSRSTQCGNKLVLRVRLDQCDKRSLQGVTMVYLVESKDYQITTRKFVS